MTSRNSNRPRSTATAAGRGPLRAVPQNATAGDVTALWAEQQFAVLKVHETPEYGSPAWVQLRAEDPRRAAAVIEAAELWRRHRAREDWLDQLLEEDPKQWFAIVTADADAEAARIAPMLARRPTNAELAARQQRPVPRPVTASPGWPPVAIPGRPGWWRHCIDGQQTDLPYRTTPGQENSA
ncbi:hypothetical protein [Streptomyces mangrovi]|uniref:hypothetical protein n=1 Tax=Streptomyces mangrovi TaxID=1206892 RepID=UPI00399CF629